MRMAIALVCLFLSTTIGAFACPQVGMDGFQIHASSSDLWSRQSFQVVAGGPEDKGYCNIRASNGEWVSGYFTDAPDFELRYYKDANYGLEFETESACDSVILINTGAGNWYFDDDDAGNLDARVFLTRPSDGWYDVWVGTMSSGNCDAMLHLETFD